MNFIDQIQCFLSGRIAIFVGSVALASPFVLSGLLKLFDFDAAIAEQRHFNMPAPAFLAGLTIAVQLGGSALLFVRRWTWLGAGLLAGFTALATLIAHRYWDIADPALRFQQQNIFWEHVAICGGLVLAAAAAARARQPK